MAMDMNEYVLRERQVEALEEISGGLRISLAILTSIQVEINFSNLLKMIELPEDKTEQIKEAVKAHGELSKECEGMLKDK